MSTNRVVGIAAVVGGLLVGGGYGVEYALKACSGGATLASADSQPESSVEVGDLISLKAGGAAVSWAIEPDIGYVSFGSQNENLVVAFKSPGRYVVISACVTEDANTQLTKYPITVKGAVPSVPKIEVPDKAEAKQLAASFRLVADSVEARLKAGILVTPQQIVKETKEANQKALGASVSKWEPWFAKLAAELQSAKIVSLPEHIAKWRTIAVQLEESSK